MAPAQVATERLQQLPNGPTHVAGDNNRSMADLLRSDRKQAIEFPSMGAASLYHKPFPLAAEN